MQGFLFCPKVLQIKGGLWLFAVVMINLGICQMALAQSGRRPPKPPPKPTITAKIPDAPLKSQTPVKIESLLIVGEIQNDHLYSFPNNTLDLTLTECLNQLESYPKVTLKASKGGKMNFKEAQDRAKNEIDVYVLWLGFVMKEDNRSDVDYVDYAILNPESAKKVTIGRIVPESLDKLKGVLGTPSTTLLKKIYPIKYVARGVIYKLVDEGWLSH